MRTTGCGGLNENVPKRLKCMNAWVPGDGPIWEKLGGVALLEEICHWGQALMFQKAHFQFVLSTSRMRFKT